MIARMTTTVTLLLGIAAAAAPPAEAGTVKLDSTCYVEGQGMTATGAGFAPGADITLSGGGAFGTAVADSAGAFVTALRVPENGTIGGTSKDIVTNTLSVQNFADSSQDTSVAFRIANLAYTVADSGGNPRKKRRFDLSGFPRGATVWAHYRFGGRTLGTVKFGTAKGDCGLLSAKMALLPAKIPTHYGTWKLQWDTKRAYSGTSLPRLTTSLSIFRTYR